MIKDAMQYLIGLKKPDIYNFEGMPPHTDGKLHPVVDRQPEKPLVVHSLSSLVGYLESGIDKSVRPSSNIISVCSPRLVEVYGRLDINGERGKFIVATWEGKTFPFGEWMSQESFIIKLSQCFAPDEAEINKLLSIVAAIDVKDESSLRDNGISQTVTVRRGVDVSAENVQRFFRLVPHRSFPEIVPENERFMLRLRVQNGAAQLALFEMDNQSAEIGLRAKVRYYIKNIIDPDGADGWTIMD